jgi:hypothetical protein
LIQEGGKELGYLIQDGNVYIQQKSLIETLGWSHELQH